jgi:hypothetical protein
MTSTKKPIISKESIDKNKELKTIHDMYREIDREIKNRDNDVEYSKNKIIDQLYDDDGVVFIEEMNENSIKRENNRIELLEQILIKYKNQNREELDFLSYENLIEYYKYLEKENNLFLKILKFFNLIK